MLVQSPLARLAPLALMFALACSAKVDLDDGDNGGGNVGGGDNGGGGAGGSNDPQCVPFHDAVPSSAVTIRFINQSGQDVYLPATCDQLNVSITPEAGEDGAYYGPTGGSCSQSCDALQSEDPVFCDAAACAPSAIRLPQGETREVVWDGRGQRSAEMPLVCWQSKDAGTTCSQIVNAPAGEYRIDVRGFADCGEGCECDDATGVCSGEAAGWEAYPNPASVSLPAADGVVEVLFDVCAFPCPG
jgi:YD repeat-containing protein